MSDLQPKPHKVKIGGEEFGLLFSLNAIEVRDERQAEIDKLSSKI